MNDDDEKAGAHAVALGGGPSLSMKAEDVLPLTRQMRVEDRLFRLAEREGRLLAPPYSPPALSRLSRENHIVGPCVAAMGQNVDGFGDEFAYVGPKDPANTR